MPPPPSPSLPYMSMTSISDLTTEVVMEILSRIPIKTLFACRCVCTSWKTLLSDPHFAILHFSRSSPNLVHLPDGKYSPLRVIDVRGVETKPDCWFHGRPRRDDVLELPLKSHFPVDENGNSAFCTNSLYSCQGLLCLLHLTDKYPTFVCNPFLGEYIAIPKPDGDGSTGFGFCSVTNQYKVIWTHDDAPYETMLYTLGERKWRSIGEAPYCLPSAEEVKIFVNGVLHWIDRDVDGGGVYLIHGFNISSEQFVEIPRPSDLAQGVQMDRLTLGELSGCLSLQCTVEGSSHLEIWVLNESWTKDYVINISLFDSIELFNPIMMMNSGDILIHFGSIAIVLYSPYWKTFRPLNEIYDFEYPVWVVAHVPSFISLKDVAKGEKVKVIRQNSRPSRKALKG